MTKESRLAIEQWTQIVASLEMKQPIAIAIIKAHFCRSNQLAWEYSCWFCQYVRQDYRDSLKSREDIDISYNGCHKCPLYKYIKVRSNLSYSEDSCGCDAGLSSLYRQVVEMQDVYAARLILRALKGEKIWNQKEG